MLQLAEVCESAGLDMVSLADHPYWSERLDTLTLLAAIASRTSRVRLLVNLANLPLRPPAMLARVAVTMDLLSRGDVSSSVLGPGVNGCGTQSSPRGDPGAVRVSRWRPLMRRFRLSAGCGHRGRRCGSRESITGSKVLSPARPRLMTSVSGWAHTAADAAADRSYRGRLGS